MRLMWDPKAKAVLVLTSSDSDPANKSYYGDAKLSFLAADGSSDAMVAIKVLCFAVLPKLSWSESCSALGCHICGIAGSYQLSCSGQLL